ncbi:hypothetical protein EV421DRAFT_1848079 [Armillaria borealis]|uniref:Uncharacterized protein n=1 Tax=Armillaria borealis TaxID=47425 RepID=A0AA39MF85_9AGAR|nr:hypothetical protein EV421DRAFT_1848079 [Armillaria borealis]
MFPRVTNILSSRAFRCSLRTSHPKIARDQISWSTANVRLLCVDVESISYSERGNGTVDRAPYLSVSVALDFRHRLGGEGVFNEYCHNLAIEVGIALTKVLEHESNE